MNAIGRAKIDFDGLVRDLPDLLYREKFTDSEDRIWPMVYAARNETDDFKIFDAAYCKVFRDCSFFSLKRQGETQAEFQLRCAREAAESEAERLHELQSYLDEFCVPLRCLYKNEQFAVVTAGGENTTLLLPAKYVEVEEYTDYSHLLASERTALLSGTPVDRLKAATHGIADYGTSVADVKQAQGGLKAQAEILKHKIENIEDAKTPELAAMQAKIETMQAEFEEKKRSLMAEMEAKKAEMEAKLEEMEMTIYRLDSEIYAIRCYTGETVEFYAVRKGDPAPINTPLVMHQKMRYLDEELGKLASIYNVDFDDVKRFEHLLKYNDLALEVFAPTARSLMLARVSKSGKGFSRQEEYANLLDQYDKYRGDRICIILRDGDNLYLGWTDDDRVNFLDDMFFRPGTGDIVPDGESDMDRKKHESDKAYADRVKKARDKTLSDSIGRYFVFAVAQGAIDRGMVKFPERVLVGAESKYIMKSYAEGWLTDNQYGTLEDMVRAGRKSVKKGDMVLTLQRLTKERDSWSNRSVYDKWNSVRGVGDRNRNHDVAASNRTIYPINKITHRARYDVSMSVAHMSNDSTEEVEETKTREKWLLDDDELKHVRECGLYARKNPSVKSVEVTKIAGTDETEYFLSLKKEYSDAGARAHLQIYSDEFWNLTFMNSVWLEYVLTTQHIGNVRIGGCSVDYAHLIPYLKTALEYVRKREAGVAEMIGNIVPAVLEDRTWPVKLSEYMLKNDIHSFGIRAVKGFCRESGV